MQKSLFHKKTPENPSPTPYERIEPEVAHLKKGSSTRYGPKAKTRTTPWLIIIALCGLAWLYLMDPFLHAWYKGEAVRDYLYLHNYGAGSMTDNLLATQILSKAEVDTINRRQGSFQDYYASPEVANNQAQAIINYMTSVRLLHDDKYQQLGPVNKLRDLLFIHTGLTPPTEWSYLDPSVGD